MLQNNPFLRQEDVLQGFSVIISPSRISVYAGDLFSFTATVLGGVNPITYQWQQSTNNVAWEDIPSAETDTLTLTASSGTTVFYYRIAATSAGSTIYSNSVKATLKGVTA